METNSKPILGETSYPLDKAGRPPDRDAYDIARNEPMRLKLIAEEYWRAFRRPPLQYANVLNPVIDDLIEERGLPPKADVSHDDQEAIREQGEGALPAAYTELVIRQHQRRNGAGNTNFEATMGEHQKITDFALVGTGFRKHDLGSNGYVPPQEFPSFINSTAAANALLDIQREIQQSMFREAFQNKYGTLAEHIERLRINSGIAADDRVATSKYHADLQHLSERYKTSVDNEYNRWCAENSRSDSPLNTMRSNIRGFMRANAFNAEQQVDMHLDWLGRRTKQGIDAHIDKVIDHYRQIALDAARKQFYRDFPLAQEGSDAAREAGQRDLTEKLMQISWQWDKLKKLHSDEPKQFEDLIIKKWGQGNQNVFTKSLMNAIYMRREHEKNLDVFSEQERLKMLQTASDRANRPLPEWFAKAKAEIEAQAAKWATQNALDSQRCEMKFGELDRGRASLGDLTNGKLMEGSTLRPPKSLFPPKPKEMPKAKPVAKPTVKQETETPRERPSISGFASSISNGIKKAVFTIRR